MLEIKDFDLAFAGLRLGTHAYDYVIDGSFFEIFDYSEFNTAKLNVHLALEKQTTLMTLVFSTQGYVNVHCDVSNEPFDLKIESTLELVVKFGEDYNDENDEILILPHGEYQLNVSKYIYEMIVLAVPMKKTHPDLYKEGFSSKEILERLNARTENNQETDPRWDKLKSFVNLKNK